MLLFNALITLQWAVLGAFVNLSEPGEFTEAPSPSYYGWECVSEEFFEGAPRMYCLARCDGVDYRVPGKWVSPSDDDYDCALRAKQYCYHKKKEYQSWCFGVRAS